MPAGPRVILCLGAGGVGKTSLSAALALASTRAGLRTLAVTLDPARRLSEALAGHADDPLLTVFEPEPREETRRLVASLLDAETRARLHDNRIFRAVSDALAGMSELTGVARLAEEVAGRAVDIVIVDTAPSRHAVRAIGLAGRVLSVVDSRTLAAIARLFGSGGRGRGLGSRLLSMAARPVARILEGAVGRGPVEEIVELLDTLVRARPQLVELAARADALLASAETRFVVVTTATASAGSAALELARDLGATGRRPDAFVLNRAVTATPSWVGELERTPGLPPALRRAVATARSEMGDHQAATELASASLEAAWPGVPIWTMPERDSADPAAVVEDLGRRMEPRLEALLGAA